MGFRVCETAIQCLGGYGYCKEYPLEQYLRDAKIMSLYEGTNGIQSMDLMGRKMRINGGAPFLAFKSEIEKFSRITAICPRSAPRPRTLTDPRAADSVAEELGRRMQSDPLQWASYTYPALISFGEVTMAWRLLDMAAVAAKAMENGRKSDFYRGKVLQATYFVGCHAAAHDGGSEYMSAGRTRDCRHAGEGVLNNRRQKKGFRCQRRRRPKQRPV